MHPASAVPHRWEGGGSSGDDGSRRKPPKEVSLTDPQATWVARPCVDPFFAYYANYLIDNKVGIIVDAEGTRETVLGSRGPLARRFEQRRRSNG